MKLLRGFWIAIWVILLTVLTQVGGLLYLLWLPIGRAIQKHNPRRLVAYGWRLFGFLAFYSLCTVAVVPILAQLSGREPLPVFYTEDLPLQPRTYLTCFMNRHYVKPELKLAVLVEARALKLRDPGFQMTYLDANFPFMNGFPLLPHRSHRDGKKLDLAFLYKDQEGRRLSTTPSWVGYGAFEAPGPKEFDQVSLCINQGYWRYDLTRFLHFWPRSQRYVFDEAGTRRLLEALSANPKIGKIFLEPHLKTRLGLGGYDKIRFHGCGSTRHDDHIHIQL
ncbi:MAG: hypothetical protein KDC44_08245 [Phaeodactylibacter sp.]|nr:hypothetical protein [Phaeodactylibacter sp.]